jgi:NTP pyrophosphatase (non-canonical NTP hydrolase)
MINAKKTISDYVNELAEVDKDEGKKDDYASVLILAIVEEVGEMARAYLARWGRKPHNIRAQKDESYKEELGDIILAIMKLAVIKNIDLDKQIEYSLNKIKKRKKVLPLD